MSERVEKVSRLIQRELSEIFQLAARNFYHGKMVTVTKVRLSSDFSFAKVFLSIFPGTETEEIMKGIEQNKKYYRHQLAVRIKNQVKAIPELAFFIDDSLDYIDNIEKILEK